MKNSKKIYSIIIVCLLSLVMSVSALAETSSNSVSSNTPSSPSSVTQNSSKEENTSSSDSDASDTSSDSEESLVSGTVSLITEDTSSKDASSNKSGYQGNVGGTVNDGIDTSGWGTGEEESSELQSVGTTDETKDKEITDFESLFWILIWIPILLIIGSIGALIYVNRKSFLNPDKSGAKSKKNSKSKNNKRTNVYKPRD